MDRIHPLWTGTAIRRSLSPFSARNQRTIGGADLALVLLLSATVIAAFGALVGGLIARFLPRAILIALWFALGIGAVLVFVQGRTADEFDRIHANVLTFAILLPCLAGSLIAGLLVWRGRAKGAR